MNSATVARDSYSQDRWSRRPSKASFGDPAPLTLESPQRSAEPERPGFSAGVVCWPLGSRRAGPGPEGEVWLEGPSLTALRLLPHRLAATEHRSKNEGCCASY